MAEVIWSPAALEDVQAIADYISRDSPHHAALFVTRLVEAAEELADFPQVGRVIPEIGEPTAREIILRPYRIMYRIEGEKVLLTGIIHGARDWPAR
ncbi:MAG: Toxin RelE4 [Phycisphaerae bacterium]|nr:Toxin RelE4 [Phycisphaerae bacterium]